MRLSHRRKVRTKYSRRQSFMVEFYNGESGIGWLIVAKNIVRAVKRCREDAFQGNLIFESGDTGREDLSTPLTAIDIKITKSNYRKNLYRYTF